MKNLYLVLAVLGAVMPYLFFLDHFGQHGFALPTFLAAAFATPAASGFAADLFIASFAFWAYAFSRRADGPNPWPFVAINLLIGLSCALPGYLYVRERARDLQPAAA